MGFCPTLQACTKPYGIHVAMEDTLLEEAVTPLASFPDDQPPLFEAVVVTLGSLPDDTLLLVVAACNNEYSMPLFEAVKGLGCVSKGVRQQLHRLQPLVGVLSLTVVQRPAHDPWRVTLLYTGMLTEAVVEQARQGRVRSIAAVHTTTPAPFTTRASICMQGTTLAPAVARRVVPGLLGAGCSLRELDMSFVRLDNTWALAFGEAALLGAVCSAVLRTLRLTGCALRGPLPELRLRALQELHLNDNQLMGGLEPFRHCTALRDLDLGSNKLTGGLEPLLRCTALQILNLSSNRRLTGGLEPLKGCTALRELFLFNNFLTGGLEPLRSCTALEVLDVGRNLLTGGLEALRGFTALHVLHLGNNQLAPASDEDKAHFEEQCCWEERDDTDSDSESEG